MHPQHHPRTNPPTQVKLRRYTVPWLQIGSVPWLCVFFFWLLVLPCAVVCLHAPSRTNPPTQVKLRRYTVPWLHTGSVPWLCVFLFWLLVLPCAVVCLHAPSRTNPPTQVKLRRYTVPWLQIGSVPWLCVLFFGCLSCLVPLFAGMPLWLHCPPAKVKIIFRCPGCKSFVFSLRVARPFVGSGLLIVAAAAVLAHWVV